MLPSNWSNQHLRRWKVGLPILPGSTSNKGVSRLIDPFWRLNCSDGPKQTLERSKKREGNLCRCAVVSPGRIHLTLKFFGNIEESKIDSIAAAIQGPVSAAKPFHLNVRGTGAFPNLRNPRVIWIGLVDEEGAWLLCKRRLNPSLEKVGFEPEDRPFRRISPWGE